MLLQLTPMRCLCWRLERELSPQQIAVVTGTGRETSKSRLRYAMTRLREVLSE